LVSAVSYSMSQPIVTKIAVLNLGSTKVWDQRRIQGGAQGARAPPSCKR